MIGKDSGRNVYLSRLSKYEKDIVRDTARDYITRDILEHPERFIDSGLRRMRPQFGEFSRENVIKEIETHKEIISAFERCTNKQDTLDSIIACVKNETGTIIIPESTGGAIATVIEDFRIGAQNFEA